tara:strand:- start:561 stop:2684 length:2124 start_codon:yes stop_codon:yes gene_type:complete
MADTTTISLDIETYGACVTDWDGNPLPPQTVFNPRRSLHTDQVTPGNLNLTAAITLVEEPLCPEFNNNSSHGLMDMKPTQTMVFRLNRPEEKERLRRWLCHSNVILGMNLAFDIQYLRADPYFRFSLENQRLIDLSVLNYLHDEMRPEKSLKSLGPVLRTHSYKTTLKHSRFPHPDHPDLLKYNAEDTHNTTLAISELAKRIHKDFSSTDKISGWCLQFYSDTIWTCIRMSEAGIPMDANRLSYFEQELQRTSSRANTISTKKYGLPLEGCGSGKSKVRFMNLACDVIDGHHLCTTASQVRTMMQPSEDSTELHGESSSELSSSTDFASSQNSVRDNPLLTITPKQKEISFSEENRNLLCDMLPDAHVLRKPFKLAKKHAAAQKLQSSYCFPLLRHRRNRPDDKSSILIPKGTSHFAYPTWYCVPTFTKDSSGASGGTLQGRITCKKPSAQTFPPSIKSCIKSRFRNGSILGFDLSQVELRVAALLSGDTALLRAYLDGDDLHKQRAIQIFGPDIEDRPDFRDLRQAGKMINFADLFRSGSNTMQQQLLAMTGQLHPISFFKSVADARPVHRPGLWAWQEERIAEARSKGYVCLPLTGQSRYFMGGDKWDVNEIVNFPVQTTAGNTLLRIQHYISKNLGSINARKPLAYMILNIYDAVYIDCHPDEIENVKEIVDYSIGLVRHKDYWCKLERYYGRSVPLEYDVEIY